MGQERNNSLTAEEQPVFSTGSRTGRWALDLRLSCCGQRPCWADCSLVPGSMASRVDLALLARQGAPSGSGSLEQAAGSSSCPFQLILHLPPSAPGADLQGLHQQAPWGWPGGVTGGKTEAGGRSGCLFPPSPFSAGWP